MTITSLAPLTSFFFSLILISSQYVAPRYVDLKHLEQNYQTKIILSYGLVFDSTVSRHLMPSIGSVVLSEIVNNETRFTTG